MRINGKSQDGFTLMEILISTVIFASTVTLMLGLFTSALRINRRVESLRQVAQGTRNFTETLTREIRNGRVNYGGMGSSCPSGNYQYDNNQTLVITTYAEEKLCFFLNTTTEELMVSKSINGNTITESINPKNFKIKSNTFRFVVRPITDPNPGVTPYNGIQPQVTIFAVFEVKLNNAEAPVLLPYQTTISTDVYDIPHYQP
jgi:prepilin-type N-terminal cleavage/methylation domain-containing protein